jgi:hypothetical protein
MLSTFTSVAGVNQRSPKWLAVVKLLPEGLPTLGTIFQLVQLKIRPLGEKLMAFFKAEERVQIRSTCP